MQGCTFRGVHLHHKLPKGIRESENGGRGKASLEFLKFYLCGGRPREGALKGGKGCEEEAVEL